MVADLGLKLQSQKSQLGSYIYARLLDILHLGIRLTAVGMQGVRSEVTPDLFKGNLRTKQYSVVCIIVQTIFTLNTKPEALNRSAYQ